MWFVDRSEPTGAAAPHLRNGIAETEPVAALYRPLAWHTPRGTLQWDQKPPKDMSNRRAHIILPGELLDQIDELVGSRGRSQFIAELARAEVHRHRLLKLLEQKGPGWDLKKHPELKQGAAHWVDSMRREDEKIDTETRSR
jgi:hypothetical protein